MPLSIFLPLHSFSASSSAVRHSLSLANKMQQFITVLVLLVFATLTSAHYALTFPYWRGSSFATQWEYPCMSLSIRS
jgi:hypothetical protein